MNSRRKEKEDTFIAVAVMISPALNILQSVMNDVYNMEDSSTTYRVILTAIPLSIAILICFIRYPRRFVVTYLISLIVLLIHMTIFPGIVEYAIKDAFRFTFPIVISCALCLSCISKIDVIEKALYIVSWIVLFLVVFYVYSFFTGKMNLGVYSMSMSYSMLLPMAAFYTRKKWYSILAFLFLLIVSLLIGSRGAIICILAYIIYDLFSKNKKILISLLFLFLFVLSTLPILVNSLETVGISSRTLNMLVEGRIGQETHRDEIRDVMYDVVKDNPIIGVGVWGDRPVLIPKFKKVSYCHNIILEIVVDFGLFVGSFIIICICSLWLRAYNKATIITRKKLIMYTATCFLPLMFSGSYLIESFFGIFIGVIFVILNTRKKNESFAYL